MTKKHFLPALIIGFIFGTGTVLTLVEEFGVARSIFLGMLTWIWVALFCAGLSSLRPRSRPITASLLFKLFAVTGIPFGIYCFFLIQFQFGTKSGLVLATAGSVVMFFFAFMISLLVRYAVFPNQKQ